MLEPFVIETPPVPDDEALGRLLDAHLPLMGIAIEAEWRPEIVANLRATANAARLVLEFPLDDELEPAPVFQA